ncbi:MAG: hypothetical protein GF317_02190 [Candidatus Lokiarchaeota archaeon]|nr:hypothetical protein [Candidatus Lokiarchaeota archaeon]
MNIKVLGTRGEIEPTKPYHSRHSGVLIDKNILFDIGEEEFIKYNPNYVFITHLHPDHAFFVRNSFDKKINFSIPLFAPESFDGIVQKLNKDRIKLGSYIIRLIPTHHSKKVKSTAYLISNNKHRILYTGDLIWINKEYHNLLKNSDLVITEASFISEQGRIQKDKKTGQIYGHAGVPSLIKLFKKFTNNILFFHFGEWFYENVPESRKKLQKLGKEHDVNIITSYDGFEINLSDLI